LKYGEHQQTLKHNKTRSPSAGR